MAGLFGLFDIGRLGLLANQLALQVNGQNIANVNTPGYSRQVAIFEETSPLDAQPGQMGTGVRISEIRRIVDLFVENQLTLEQSNLGRYQIDEQSLGRIEAVFNDSQGTGIHQALADFFAALQDLTNNPQDRPERVALLERGRTLAQQFVTADTQLQQIRKDLDTEIQQVITTVNALANQIADLNEKISRAELTGQKANDLRDERGRLLNDLSKLIDLNTFEDSLGHVTVMVGGGKPLVETNKAYALSGVANADNLGFVNVMFSPATGTTINITSSITNGRLKGLLDLRDSLLPGYIDQVDQLAAGIVNEINQQHRTGYGLDSSTTNDFFSALTTTVSGLSANTGSAVISVTIATPSSLTLDPYELTFSSGTYTLRNLTTGSSSSSGSLPITFEGIQVSLTSGSPASGDIFRISAHQGTAGRMSVAITDPNRVAAASTLAGLPGDNGNALLLAQVRDRSVTALGGVNLQSFYGGLMGTVGSRSQQAQRSLDAQELILDQLNNQREAASGVSLDEEMTHLIKFQRAYEASARFLVVVDELLQTLLTLKK